MRQWLPLCVVLSLILLSSTAFSGVITQPLLERMEEVGENELIPVYIMMEKQADVHHLMNMVRGKSRDERRELVVPYMKGIRDQSQGEVLSYLESMEVSGKVERIRSLWVVNLVSFRAPRKVIETVSGISGVSRLNLNEDHILVPPNPAIPYLPMGGRELVWNVTKVRAPEVWALGYTGDGIIVSVCDTGVRYTHNDLADHIWTNPGEIPNNNIDDDGNGYTDDYYGYDFNGNDDDPMDDHGHGTHCAGTVAGDGTAGCSTGVAPDARIMSCKVLNSGGGGNETDVMEAMQYSLDMGAHAISMSLGWSHAWSPDRPAWRNTCITLLAGGLIQSIAAGNEDNNYGPPDNVRTPGDCPPPWLHPDQTLSGGLSSVVTIGATDVNDNIASFSSRGPVSWENISPWNDYDYQPGMGLIDPDISAPGVDIKSLSYTSNSGYVSGWSGTSMATPHVAGAMALMYQKADYLDIAMIDSILEVTSLDLGAGGKDNVFGAGRLDCYDAVEATPDTIPRCEYYSHSIDDNTAGNGDGVISQLETIYVPLWVRNRGGATAKDVEAYFRLAASNSYITLVDTFAAFGNIMADSIAQGSPDYSFSVANGIANGDTVWFELEMMDSGGGDWFGYFSEVVWNPELSYEGLLIDDAGEWRPNGILNPGETVDMILSVMNSNGYAHATGLSGVLRISDTYVSVVDSTAAFPDISPGGTVDNSSSPFEVYADNGLPYDHQVDCELILTGDNVVDTMYFSFIAGERTEDDPTGPDDYAYWAYDMYDTLYTECPTYGWEEVDPNYGGSGTDLVLGDNETKQLALPFSFKYYGTDYDTISVCSNGWLALGVTSDTDFRYYAPPDVMGPPAAVGVFWGSLDPSAAGGVYYYYDSGLHAFIVEWSRVDHENTAGEETFQVLLSDPAYNPTVTGDGEIFCQYLYVTYPDNSMTAIEDETETLGLLYQISDSPDPGAAPLADAFVCKFTTDPPQYVVGMSESDKPAMPKVYGLSQSYPNPCGSHAVINYQLPRKSGVSLRVYDVSGRLVDELVSGAIDAGYHSVRLDTKSYMSGVYFYRLVAGNRVFMKKMIVVK